MKVHNQIFDYELTPTAMKVYVYLTCCTNELATATVRTKVIANACCISSHGTVHHAVAELEEKGLLHKKRRYNSEGRSISNQYIVTQLSGKWFALPKGIDLFVLPKSAFMVLLYLLKCKDKCHKAFPRIREMAAKLKASCNTIMDALHDLVSKRLVRKAPRWKGKHNLYYVCAETPAKTKKEGSAAPTQHYPKPTEECTIIFPTNILDGVRKLVKGVHTLVKKFCSDACIKKWTPISEPIKSTTVKKKE